MYAFIRYGITRWIASGARVTRITLFSRKRRCRSVDARARERWHDRRDLTMQASRRFCFVAVGLPGTPWRIPPHGRVARASLVRGGIWRRVTARVPAISVALGDGADVWPGLEAYNDFYINQLIELLTHRNRVFCVTGRRVRRVTTAKVWESMTGITTRSRALARAVISCAARTCAGAARRSFEPTNVGRSHASLRRPNAPQKNSPG